ncbi:MAG: hypothetical protein AAFP86_08180 [Planctomycetota bacterium]
MPIGTSDAGAPWRVGPASVRLLARARSGSGASPVRGAVPAWIPLAALFAALLVAVRSLEQDARSRGVAEIDTLRYRLQEGSRWLSPAWRGALEDTLVASRGLVVDDPGAIEDFVLRVSALPFVAEVGEPEVIWPDGLSLPLRLHEPVACIATGDGDFLPVASDGTVLGGFAFAPHEAYGGWLPVLGPHGLATGDVRPGDALDHPALRDALLVAESLWRYLEVGDLRRLGRILVDASADSAPVFDRDPKTGTPTALPGGVVLALEDGRRVVFGRPPVPIVPGELPVGRKWRHLASALEARDGGEDWSLVDVRFDEAVRLDRAAVEEYAERGVIESLGR